MDKNQAPDKAALAMLISGMKRLELDELRGMREGKEVMQVQKEGSVPEPEEGPSLDDESDDMAPIEESEEPVDDKELKRKELMKKLNLK